MCLRRLLVAILAVVCLPLALLGCGAVGAGPKPLLTRRQTVDQLTIALEAPERPALLAEQELLVELTDARGRPVDGAEVWLGLVMPTMQHSPNEPDAVSAGAGKYRARALFTMAGYWNVEVHATVQGQEYIATFQTPVS